MNAHDAWRNRSMTVQVLDRCDTCETLKQDVSQRKETGYYPSKWTVDIRSCASCFETAKNVARAQAGSTALVCMESQSPAAVREFQRGWNDAAMGRSFDLARFPCVEYCAGYQESAVGRVE